MTTFRQRLAGWIAPEMRATYTQRDLRIMEALGGEQTSSGQRPTPTNVEGLAAVIACVNRIASSMASLPVYVYRREGRGRVEDPGHPVAALMSDPNPNAPWPMIIEWAMGSVLLRGNALLRIERDDGGNPVALYPVPWERVVPVLLPNGRLAYDVTLIPPEHGASAAGNRIRLLDTEVLHLRDRSDDGLVGRSRISRADEVLGNALALQEWSGAMWRNAATPVGALMFKTRLTREALDDLRTQFEQGFSGPRNARKALIIGGDGEWKSMSVSPEDAEVLASRRFTAEELARIFDVPPPLVGIWDHSSFTNSETAGRWFATFTLAPWVRKIEAEFQRSIFVGEERTTHQVEMDLSGLMRGDYTARWQAHEIAVRNGILDTNEIREIEGWNPRPDAPKPPPAEEPNVG